ncbi:rho GTPase-activating protein 11A isoform X2 [Genypterus blacodes]|uniref:rho GTPase-activating protein 11A isoform X2 n=1 Tax=Genypterus blacodes TaxID=154954 RepID=UPI003F765E2B
MKVRERNAMRLLAVQQLRAAYGIKTKNWNKNKAANCKSTSGQSLKVFGVPLENLPHYNMECGSVPSFLVDACMRLLAHVDTEGLFRKSGSIVRLKALQAKLDAGEECLSTALPCDMASLVKQFFRELPEPALPAELQESFLKTQQLHTEEERSSAAVLLSCVLPDRNQSLLRYFFDFLHNVSMRSAENKMDSSNLSLILAPNLLHSGDSTDKLNASTEKRLKLQAALIHCFIANAHSFGVLPQFLQEKIPTMMGCDPGILSPPGELEELDSNSGVKRRHRISIGVFSSATPVIATPASKRKLPAESGAVFGLSNKRRRSIKKNLGIDLFPSALFSGTSTPGSAYSAEVLDSSHNNPPSAGRSTRRLTTSARRKSRRLSNMRMVNRVESGRAGCFSPKVAKKEAPLKFLRSRLSLGRSSKDAASGSVGRRLATQESTSFCFHQDPEFSSPLPHGKAEAKSSQFISRSEDNLLTPQRDSSTLQISWSGETPKGAQMFVRRPFTDTTLNMCLKNNYTSEPNAAVSKAPGAAGLPKKLCCASSAISLESEGYMVEARSNGGPTLLKITRASSEPGSDLQAAIRDCCSFTGENLTETPTTSVPTADTETSRFAAPQRFLATEQNITFGQLDLAALSPLHIDSAIFDSGAAGEADEGSICAPVRSNKGSVLGEAECEQVNCSRLIDALDIQSPAHFKLGVSSGLQSTPYRVSLQFTDDLNTPYRVGTEVGSVHDKNESYLEVGTKDQSQQPLEPNGAEGQAFRVADHIHHFNKLTLRSPRGAKARHVRSPLKFQRTPVRQAVRRINSLVGDRKRPAGDPESPTGQNAQMGKTARLESFSTRPQLQPQQGEVSDSVCPKKKPPPVPPKRHSTLARKPKAGALGDMTNKIQPKARVDVSVPAAKTDPSCAQVLVQQVSEKEASHYRGSPRHPLNQARLLSATRPIDL